MGDTLGPGLEAVDWPALVEILGVWKAENGGLQDLIRLMTQSRRSFAVDHPGPFLRKHWPGHGRRCWFATVFDGPSLFVMQRITDG